MGMMINSQKLPNNANEVTATHNKAATGPDDDFSKASIDAELERHFIDLEPSQARLRHLKYLLDLKDHMAMSKSA